MIRKYWWIVTLFSILFAVLTFTILKWCEKSIREESFVYTFVVQVDDPAAQSCVNGTMAYETEAVIWAYNNWAKSTKAIDTVLNRRWHNQCYRQLKNHRKLALQCGFWVPNSVIEVLENYRSKS